MLVLLELVYTIISFVWMDGARVIAIVLFTVLRNRKMKMYVRILDYSTLDYSKYKVYIYILAIF